MFFFVGLMANRIVLHLSSTEECISQENTATRFCAKMKTTIISSMEHSDDDTMNSQNFVEFLVASALQIYMEDEEYPIVLQALQLTYLGPRWVSFDRFGLSLLGDIPGKMNFADQRIFRRAVSAFIDDDKQPNLFEGATDVAIRHQTYSREDAYSAEQNMNPAPSDLLRVEVTLFQKLLGESNMSSGQYFDDLKSRFKSDPDRFLGHYLRTGYNDDFFLNVHTVQVATSEGNAIEIPVSTLSLSTKAQSISPEPENLFNFKALAVSVAVLPLMVLLIACVFISILSAQKRSGQRRSTKSSEQEVIVVE